MISEDECPDVGLSGQLQQRVVPDLEVHDLRVGLPEPLATRPRHRTGAHGGPAGSSPQYPRTRRHRRFGTGAGSTPCRSFRSLQLGTRHAVDRPEIGSMTAVTPDSATTLGASVKPPPATEGDPRNPIHNVFWKRHRSEVEEDLTRLRTQPLASLPRVQVLRRSGEHPGPRRLGRQPAGPHPRGVTQPADLLLGLGSHHQRLPAGVQRVLQLDHRHGRSPPRPAETARLGGLHAADAGPPRGLRPGSGQADRGTRCASGANAISSPTWRPGCRCASSAT